jgi:hypothetical protein
VKFQLQRRRLLAAAAKWPLVLALVRESLAEPANTAHEIATFRQFSWLLFPFPQAGMEPYEKIAALVSREQPAVLSGIASTLDSQHTGRWLELPEEAQLRTLQGIESGEQFQQALGNVRGRLFADPAIWVHIGYEGSSLEFGGYANRGLDDIDWL